MTVLLVIIVWVGGCCLYKLEVCRSKLSCILSFFSESVTLGSPPLLGISFVLCTECLNCNIMWRDAFLIFSVWCYRCLLCLYDIPSPTLRLSAMILLRMFSTPLTWGFPPLCPASLVCDGILYISDIPLVLLLSLSVSECSSSSILSLSPDHLVFLDPSCWWHFLWILYLTPSSSVWFVFTISISLLSCLVLT